MHMPGSFGLLQSRKLANALVDTVCDQSNQFVVCNERCFFFDLFIRRGETGNFAREATMEMAPLGNQLPKSVALLPALQSMLHVLPDLGLVSSGGVFTSG